jgi:hypothetical protein
MPDALDQHSALGSSRRASAVALECVMGDKTKIHESPGHGFRREYLVLLKRIGTLLQKAVGLPAEVFSEPNML